jgi:hypothetical protein
MGLARPHPHSKEMRAPQARGVQAGAVTGRPTFRWKIRDDSYCPYNYFGIATTAKPAQYFINVARAIACIFKREESAR